MSAQMSDAEPTEFYRYLHCNMRLRTRYGLEIDIDEYRRLNELFQRREVINLRETSTGDLEGWIPLRGIWVCGHYKSREGRIASFMPVPPPAPEIIENRVVDAKSAQKHRQHMETLQAQRELKELDVRWYKTRAHEVKSLIQAGHLDDAVKILDDMASKNVQSTPVVT
jgi:hypothetical protein